MGRKTAVVNICLLFEKQHNLVTGSWKKLKWWTGERGCRRQAVMEERRKSRSVFSAVSLRVVLRYLLAQTRFGCFEQIVLWQENGSPELKIEQKWGKMWIDGARNSNWMDVKAFDGWEVTERPGGDRRVERGWVVWGERRQWSERGKFAAGGLGETATQPEEGVNVSFVQRFMTPCQRAGPLTAQILKCVADWGFRWYFLKNSPWLK